MIARHVIVAGHVQGVGYRAWTASEAKIRGLRGWVRNRRDGNVEAVFAGAEEVVLEMVDRCWRGPPLARVERVNVAEADARASEGFLTLGTV